MLVAHYLIENKRAIQCGMACRCGSMASSDELWLCYLENRRDCCRPSRRHDAMRTVICRMARSFQMFQKKCAGTGQQKYCTLSLPEAVGECQE